MKSIFFLNLVSKYCTCYPRPLFRSFETIYKIQIGDFSENRIQIVGVEDTVSTWANLGLFFSFILSFQTNNTIFQQINVKNVHPVYGAGIRTHDLSNMSRHP